MATEVSLPWSLFPNVDNYRFILYITKLSWFQTSLPLTALLLHRVITVCCFKLAALGGHWFGFSCGRRQACLKAALTLPRAMKQAWLLIWAQLNMLWRVKTPTMKIILLNIQTVSAQHRGLILNRCPPLGVFRLHR